MRWNVPKHGDFFIVEKTQGWWIPGLYFQEFKTLLGALYQAINQQQAYLSK